MDTSNPLFAARQRHSPIRSPAWRWERAQRIIAKGRNFTRRRDDEQTRQAVCYLRALRRCSHERQQERLARTYPDVHASHLLHEQAGTTTVEVQARLLAGQSPEEIAHRTDVPVPTINSYEALFFNVRDRLHARDWISAYAVGWWRFDPAMGRDPATILKGYAYHGGPVVLDAVLPHLRGDHGPVLPTHAAALLDDRLEHTVRLALELEMLPWNATTAAQICKLHLELIASARKPSSGRSTTGIVAQNVLETLENLADHVVQQASPPAALPSPEVESHDTRRIG